MSRSKRPRGTPQQPPEKGATKKRRAGAAKIYPLPRPPLGWATVLEAMRDPVLDTLWNDSVRELQLQQAKSAHRSRIYYGSDAFTPEFKRYERRVLAVLERQLPRCAFYQLSTAAPLLDNSALHTFEVPKDKCNKCRSSVIRADTQTSALEGAFEDGRPRPLVYYQCMCLKPRQLYCIRCEFRRYMTCAREICTSVLDPRDECFGLVAVPCDKCGHPWNLAGLRQIQNPQGPLVTPEGGRADVVANKYRKVGRSGDAL